MVPSRWELGPAVDACFGARGEGKAREFGAAIQNELDFAVANSVANPMNLTALNVRVANTWKRKIRR